MDEDAVLQGGFTGVGNNIVGINSRHWGRVVAEEKHGWRLEDGRVARKSGENRKWRWELAQSLDWTTTDNLEFSESPQGSPETRDTDSSPCSLWTSPTLSQNPSLMASPLLLPAPAVSLEDSELTMMPGTEPAATPRSSQSVLIADQWQRVEVVDAGDGGGSQAPSCSDRSPGSQLSRTARGIGGEIVGMDGIVLGQVVGKDKLHWRLDDGTKLKKATEGRRWRWVVKAPSMSTSSPTTAALQEEAFPEFVASAASEWLPLQAARRTALTCRGMSKLFSGCVPLSLPQPQADAFLQFCLLEVLVTLEEERLPLPMSAIYHEMRAAARRAASNPAVLRHLENLIFKPLGRASRQQDDFLKSRCPHHIAWSLVELKDTSFRTLEKMAKYFDGERLIRVFHQRWRKRIHHSPNTRTCWEWLLTNVKRDHVFFREHEEWTRIMSDVKQASQEETSVIDLHTEL